MSSLTSRRRYASISSFGNIASPWKHLKTQPDILIWSGSHAVPGVLSAGRCDTVLSPLTVCSSTVAAMGPEDRAGAGPGGTSVCPLGPQACVSTTTHESNVPDRQQTLVSGWRETCRFTCILSPYSTVYCLCLHSVLQAVWVNTCK